MTSVKFGKFEKHFFAHSQTPTDGDTVYADVLVDNARVGTIEGEYTENGAYDGSVRIGSYAVRLNWVPEGAEDCEIFPCISRKKGERIATAAGAKRKAKAWILKQLKGE